MHLLQKNKKNPTEKNQNENLLKIKIKKVKREKLNQHYFIKNTNTT